MPEIKKEISFRIENQFPAIYRENGQELVKIVEEYYRFSETQENQYLYNSRRLFDYKDIDTTINRFLLFFKNKYLSELPFDDNTIRIIVKNILSLYRRRGTNDGLKLFFSLFYQENVKTYLPAKDIFKASDSDWKVGTYIRLYPNQGRFKSSASDKIFTYRDLLGKTIEGTNTKARAVVDKINFILFSNTLTPIIYLNFVVGEFAGFDKITAVIDGEPAQFGEIYGSMDAVEIDETFAGTVGNKVGEIYNVEADNGFAGKVIVTEINENFTGQVSYQVIDGGFGYTLENTNLYVSNQSIRFNPAVQFNVLENLQDQFGNTGFVVGQNENFVGIKMDDGNEFTTSSNISTLDRDNNVTIDSSQIFFLTDKNGSSPGPLFPETGDPSDVKVGELENVETVSLITDIIGNFTDVPLNAINYNDVPPALVPMSGTADPTNIDTALEDAFDLSPFEIGTIKNFINTNPGDAYVNDVFAIAVDPIMKSFNKFRQIITLENFSAAFSVGTIIKQGNVLGKVEKISESSLFVLPFSYFGFDIDQPITLENGTIQFNISSISTDFGESTIGFNAEVDAETSFAAGRIRKVDVINSGFGYVDQSRGRITDDSGEVQAEGIIQARGQGITEGFWSSFNSHLNGYVEDNGELDYFNAGKFIQDSDFYQEYSYQVKSMLDINTYERLLKEINHPAGTKLFSEFEFEQLASSANDIRSFISFQPIPDGPVTIDATDVTVDDTDITIDSQ